MKIHRNYLSINTLSVGKVFYANAKLICATCSS